MRDFAKVAPTFWSGDTGKALRKKDTDGRLRLLALYLVTSPHAHALGLYDLPLAYLGHDLRLTEEEALDLLAVLSSLGFAHYDPETERVWVVEMAAFQIGKLKEKDNRVAWVGKELGTILPRSPFAAYFVTRYQAPLRIAADLVPTDPPMVLLPSPSLSPLEAPPEAPPEGVDEEPDKKGLRSPSKGGSTRDRDREGEETEKETTSARDGQDEPLRPSPLLDTDPDVWAAGPPREALASVRAELAWRIGHHPIWGRHVPIEDRAELVEWIVSTNQDLGAATVIQEIRKASTWAESVRPKLKAIKKDWRGFWRNWFVKPRNRIGRGRGSREAVASTHLGHNPQDSVEEIGT